jgi:dTDP-4-amino-4,6-dideoxy-D-galactose acyltransferase
MICERLEWDSDFFEIEITEINYDSNTTFKVSNIESYELIYLKNCFLEHFTILGFKLKFQQTKVLFSKSINKSNFYSSNLVFDFDYHTIDNHRLYPLAFESGNYSRFNLDLNFKTQKFEELYKKWVDNSINKKIADKIFYIKVEENIEAFVTVKKNINYATIGLIGVSKDSQGKGYGTILLNIVEKYCVDNGIFELQIPTQKENLLACKFYSKLGYEIIQEINIKHYWKL